MVNTNTKSNIALLAGQKKLIFLLLYIGIAQVLDYFFSYRVANLSFFVTVVPYAFILLIFLKNIKIFNDGHTAAFFLIVLLFIIISLFRGIIFNNDIISIIGANRYVVFVPAAIMVCDKIQFKGLESIIQKILIFILVVHTLNSVGYMFGFYSINNVDVLAEGFVEDSRFAGIMGGANTQSSFTGIVYVILLFSNLKRSVLYVSGITLLAFLASAPTVSRGGLLIIILALLYYFYLKLFRENVMNRIRTVAIFLILSFVAVVNFDPAKYEFLYASLFDRLDTSTGRIERLVYFWDVMNENVVYYFIGVPAALQDVDETRTISDNTFTLLPINFGFFFTCIFIGFIFVLIRDKHRSKIPKTVYIYMMIVFIVLFSNNAILWTAWSYYAIFGFFYLKHLHSNNDLNPLRT
ncbi:hypothetical protein [Chryseobacterium sp.]|uniref:hypothetical protein n=1 Tax=Chryseobacterium sp. TaxID=1871047 RepID=UPI0011C71CF6|nr:hypothetical protein [Chryseobacterium sp.]TXF77532.1 hypothetical protein FUA25_06290 [Chryseobacterium sp.]